MNRAELQTMTAERVRDSAALLAAGRWEFAYYSARYTVECALKSCVLSRMIITAWVFEEKWEAKRCLTHDISALIDLAGLRGELDTRKAAGGSFRTNLTTVSEWKVTSRYEAKTEAAAKGLYDAITDNPDGMLPWIQKYW